VRAAGNSSDMECTAVIYTVASELNQYCRGEASSKPKGLSWGCGCELSCSSAIRPGSHSLRLLWLGS